MEPPAGATFRLQALVALVLVSLLLGPATVPAAAPSGDDPFALAGAQVDADAVLLSGEVRADGDARWRVEYRVRLDDSNDTAAFEDLSREVEQNESAFVTRFEDRMTATVRDAAAATGRDMTVRNVSVTTTTRQLPQQYGVLVYTFEWTNFAVVEGDRIRAGDALAGFFLDADSSLRFAWPEGYASTAVAPEPSERGERSVVWRGPAEFGPGEPRLVVSAGGSTDGVDTSLVGLAVVAVALVGGTALWWRSRSGGVPAPSEPGSGDSGGSTPPPELLSNEERVIALLEQHGGRMKQQAVVEELGWTDAKTSQVVGRLRDAGDVEGFRLGRENVLRLPEVDESPAPGEVGSHDEGE